jgi:broad specificity phosphatase PhoE
MLNFPSFNLYLIRHGQSESNVDPDRMGQTPEVPLTRLGESQSNALGSKLRSDGIVFDRIFSSPYTRALYTAQIVNSYFGNQNIVLADDLREYDAGDWKGTSRKETVTPDIKLSMGYFTNAFAPPNGESLNAVERRATKWLDDFIMFNNEILTLSDKKMSDSNKPLELACFTHGMTIKCLLHHIMGFDKSITWKISVDNTSVSKLSFDHEGWKVRYLNNCSHLRDNSFA